MELYYQEGKLAWRILLLGFPVGCASLPSFLHWIWYFPIFHPSNYFKSNVPHLLVLMAMQWTKASYVVAFRQVGALFGAGMGIIFFIIL